MTRRAMSCPCRAITLLHLAGKILAVLVQLPLRIPRFRLWCHLELSVAITALHTRLSGFMGGGVAVLNGCLT